VPQHRRGLRADQLQRHRLALAVGEGCELGRKRARRRPSHRGVDQPAQNRRQRAGGGLGAQGGGVEVDRRRERLAAAEGGVEELQAQLGRDRGEAEAGANHLLVLVQFGGAERAGHPALLLPQPPGDRGGGEAAEAAVLGEAVEEGVRGRVVALPGPAEQAGGRGEEDEGGEIEARRQLVQVPGGIGLGSHDALQALGIERLDHDVVEDPGGMDHRPERVLRGNRAQKGLDLEAVADVAGGDLNLCPGAFELGAELLRPLRRGAATAAQQQVAGAVGGDQVAGDQGAEAAGAAGDQDRRSGVELERISGDGRRRPCQPRGESASLAQGELWMLSRRGGDREGGEGRRGVVVVDQREAAGVLGLGGAQQPPNRGEAEPGILSVADRDRALREQRQPGSGQGLGGEKGLNQGEGALGVVAGAAGAIRRLVRGEAGE
jgi:hypothetical protein